MWERIRQLLTRIFGSSQEDSEAREVDETRARFWAELREGEREAEAKSRR